MEQYFHIYLIFLHLDQIPSNFNYETMIHLIFLLTMNKYYKLYTLNSMPTFRVAHKLSNSKIGLPFSISLISGHKSTH